MMVGAIPDPGQLVLVIVILVSRRGPPALLPENKTHGERIDFPPDGADLFENAHGSIMVAFLYQIKSHGR